MEWVGSPLKVVMEWVSIPLKAVMEWVGSHGVGEYSIEGGDGVGG